MGVQLLNKKLWHFYHLFVGWLLFVIWGVGIVYGYNHGLEIAWLMMWWVNMITILLRIGYGGGPDSWSVYGHLGSAGDAVALVNFGLMVVFGLNIFLELLMWFGNWDLAKSWENVGAIVVELLSGAVLGYVLIANGVMPV